MISYKIPVFLQKQIGHHDNIIELEKAMWCLILKLKFPEGVETFQKVQKLLGLRPIGFLRSNAFVKDKWLFEICLHVLMLKTTKLVSFYLTIRWRMCSYYYREIGVWGGTIERPKAELEPERGMEEGGRRPSEGGYHA